MWPSARAVSRSTSFSTRVDQVFASTTDVELNGTWAGLPEPAPAPIPVARSDGRDFFRRRANHIVRGATPAIVCTAVWAMTGHGSFWPEWVWLGTGSSPCASCDHATANHDAQQAIERGHGTPGTAAVTPEVRRMVLTAVFMDIVGSTEKATALGDPGHGGRGPFASEQLVARELEGAQGSESSSRRGTRSSRPFAHPPTDPLPRVPCARRSSRCRSSSGSASHTGEVEGRHRDLRGIALHIGQRVSAAAAPGEILVSSDGARPGPGLGYRVSSIVATMSSAASRTPWRLYGSRPEPDLRSGPVAGRPARRSAGQTGAPRLSRGFLGSGRWSSRAPMRSSRRARQAGSAHRLHHLGGIVAQRVQLPLPSRRGTVPGRYTRCRARPSRTTVRRWTSTPKSSLSQSGEHSVEASRVGVGVIGRQARALEPRRRLDARDRTEGRGQVDQPDRSGHDRGCDPARLPPVSR